MTITPQDIALIDYRAAAWLANRDHRGLSAKGSAIVETPGKAACYHLRNPLLSAQTHCGAPVRNGTLIPLSCWGNADVRWCRECWGMSLEQQQ